MTETKRYRWHVIHDRIRDIPNPIGAEIGVHRGECSGHLLQLHPGLKLYMIDMWSPDTYKGKGDDAATGPYRELYQKQAEENYFIARDNIKNHEERAEMWQCESILASISFQDGFLDFAFIDASHSYEDVKADILAWLPKIKKCGYLFLHDYKLFSGVTEAVHELFHVIETDSDYMAVIRL